MPVAARSRRMDDLKGRHDGERVRLGREMSSRELSSGEEHAGYGDHLADDASALLEQAGMAGLRRGVEWLLAQGEEAPGLISDGF